MLGIETQTGLKYISKFDDFSECMEPNVFQVLQEFYREQDFKELEDLQIKIEHLEEKLEESEDERDSLNAECDSMQTLLDDTENKLNRLLDKMYAECIQENELLSCLEEIREDIHNYC